ncbi:MAG: response regulator transcription factor [Flavobacteriales bacterium]
MKKIVIAYALVLALFVLALKLIDHRFVTKDISMDIYLGLVALLFTVFGIWLGLKLTRPQVKLQVITPPFELDHQKLDETGLSQRELEVLEMMSKGLSNQEIADRLFISLNTVKTHSTSLFTKLDVKRRTQAVKLAKEWSLIP